MTIGIGIIGANPDYGWGVRAHMPAIASIAGAHIAAVATTRAESARAAAEATGAAHWYVDPDELSRDPDVDLVVVSVKVAHHDRLVRAAIDAGKHVYCEWPLATTTAEAQSLTARADDAGVQAFVGLQARTDPVVEEARALIAAGRIGELTTVSVRSSVRKGFDHTIDNERLYTVDAVSRAGNVEVQGGHLLDLVDRLVGGVDVTAAATALTRPELRRDNGESVTATAPDVFTASLALRGNGIGAVTAWYGDPVGGTEIVIGGIKGTVVLTAALTAEGYAQQPQMAPFTATVTTASTTYSIIGPSDRLPARVENIAGLYRWILADLADGGTRAPRFVDALRIHHMLDTVRSGSSVLAATHQ